MNCLFYVGDKLIVLCKNPKMTHIGQSYSNKINKLRWVLCSKIGFCKVLKVDFELFLKQ